MQPVDSLQASLIALYNQDSTYYTNYTGSWIADAVYQFDYPTLGELLSQMLPLTEATTFAVMGEIDGHNAFEEFVCDVLWQLFQQRGVISDSEGGEPAKIDPLKLQAMLSECGVF